MERQFLNHKTSHAALFSGLYSSHPASESFDPHFILLFSSHSVILITRDAHVSPVVIYKYY